MEIGASRELRSARPDIHSPSDHSYSRSQTREPVRGGNLPGKGVGVALVDPEAVAAGDDVVLVDGALPDTGDEASQIPELSSRGLQGVGGGIPAVEVADDGDGLGVRGPDGEEDPLGALPGKEVGPQLAIEIEVVSLPEEVHVVLRQQNVVLTSPCNRTLPGFRSYRRFSLTLLSSPDLDYSRAGSFKGRPAVTQAGSEYAGLFHPD